jgi:hypothetical protein
LQVLFTVIIPAPSFSNKSIFMAFKIKFGTDDWRGIIAEDYTFEYPPGGAGLRLICARKGQRGQVRDLRIE